MDTTYIDTETTSLIAPYLSEGRRTWEVALVRVPEDGSSPLCAWLQITDVDLTHANDESLAIGRFDARFHPDQYGPLGPTVTRPWGDPRPVELWGCTEANAAQTIDELTAGAVLAGSNPGFDADNFADLMRRHGLLGSADPRWWHHHRDVPNIATGYLRQRFDIGAAFGLDRLDSPAGDGWHSASYSTRVLSEAVHVPQPVDRHSAWADTIWMMNVDAAIGGPSARLNPAHLATLDG